MKLYVFDLDKTLLNVNSSFSYYRFLRKKKIISIFSLIKALQYASMYLYFDLSPKKLHEKVFNSFLKDKPVDKFLEDIDFFVDMLLDKHINLDVFSILKKAKKDSHVLLLSSSPSFLVKPIANKLGISHYDSTLYEVKKNRFFKILKVMDGVEKAKKSLEFANTKNIKKENIFAFSDSIWDRPLLEEAGRVFIVNPDKKLLSLAKAKHWEII